MTLKNALKSSLSLSESRSEREAYKLNQIQISRPKTISNFTHRGRKSDDPSYSTDKPQQVAKLVIVKKKTRYDS